MPPLLLLFCCCCCCCCCCSCCLCWIDHHLSVKSRHADLTFMYSGFNAPRAECIGAVGVPPNPRLSCAETFVVARVPLLSVSKTSAFAVLYFRWGIRGWSGRLVKCLCRKHRLLCWPCRGHGGGSVFALVPLSCVAVSGWGDACGGWGGKGNDVLLAVHLFREA